MFNVGSFECICAAWKLWLSRLVERPNQNETATRERHSRNSQVARSRSRLDLRQRSDGSADSFDSLLDRQLSSRRNRHSWHVGTSDSAGFALDPGDVSGSPGEPHSGFNGIPHGEYRRQWKTSISRQSTTSSTLSVIHQSSCPTSFSKKEKPSRDLSLPLKIESQMFCNTQDTECGANEQELHQNHNENGNSIVPMDTTFSNRKHHHFLTSSDKQNAIDEGDSFVYANANNNGSTNESNRLEKCKDCGGRITISITSPSPTTSAPRPLHRFKRWASSCRARSWLNMYPAYWAIIYHMSCVFLIIRTSPAGSKIRSPNALAIKISDIYRPHSREIIHLVPSVHPSVQIDQLLSCASDLPK